MCVHEPVLEENQPRIDTACLIEAIENIARPFVDAHHSDIGASPEGFLQARHCEIRVGVGAARTRFHIHNAKFQVSNPAREFGSAVNRNLIAGDGIDSDLPAEEQLVLVPQGEIEYASVFEKKLALLGNEYFEWRDVERFEIDFGIGKVRVAR